MSQAVVEDLDQFKAFLAAQPLCKWAAQAQRESAAGIHGTRRRASAHPHAPKNDNSDLAAALSSMA